MLGTEKQNSVVFKQNKFGSTSLEAVFEHISRTEIIRHFLITKHKKDRTIYNYILRLFWGLASSVLPRRLMTRSSVPSCQLGRTIHLHKRLRLTQHACAYRIMDHWRSIIQILFYSVRQCVHDTR